MTVTRFSYVPYAGEGNYNKSVGKMVFCDHPSGKTEEYIYEDPTEMSGDLFLSDLEKFAEYKNQGRNSVVSFILCQIYTQLQLAFDEAGKLSENEEMLTKQVVDLYNGFPFVYDLSTK